MLPTKAKWLYQSPKKNHNQNEPRSYDEPWFVIPLFLPIFRFDFLLLLSFFCMESRILRCTSYAHFVTLAVGYSYLFFGSHISFFVSFSYLTFLVLRYLLEVQGNRCLSGVLIVIILLLFDFGPEFRDTPYSSYSHTYFFFDWTSFCGGNGLFPDGISTIQCI
jgi:hypothetical protein